MRDLTLVFDLDGTLVDTAPDLVASTNHVMDHLGLPPVDAVSLRPYIGLGAKHMIIGAVGPAAEAMSASEHEALVERYLGFYSDHIADSSHPFDGLVPVLERLKGEGVKLAVCTNKVERLARVLLDALDLTRHFVAIAGGDTFGVPKPHPAALLGTVTLARGDRRHAVMIGDSGIDVATARAAGVPVIGVSFGYTEKPIAEFAPDTIIDHFSELEQAIARVPLPKFA